MRQNWRRERGIPALTYGTTWHKIKEAHYKTGGNKDAVYLAAEGSWQDHGNADDHRTLQRCLSAYEAFLAKYGNYEQEAENWGETVGYPENPIIEKATELSWPGGLHPYTGKIDRVFHYQGLYFVEDTKTTSALGVHYFSQFDPSNQMMGYAFLAGLLTGLPIAGVRICAHGVLKTQDKFERRTMMYSPERLEEWGRNLNIWVERLDESMRIAQEADRDRGTLPQGEFELAMLRAFPHNFNACAAKYGQCSYTEVCTMPARLRDRVLASEFQQVPWNPLASEEADNGTE